ncbi:hypothetical protein AVM02_05880 [Brucella anthropi]
MVGSDSLSPEFGELYFSFIDCGYVKGWKRHNRMSSNLIVPVGTVKFVFIGENSDDRLEIISGEGAHRRISVPPGFWMAFSGLAKGPNLVVNIADIPHDDNEEDRKSLAAFEF